MNGAGYSSSISGDRPEEVTRIRHLTEVVPVPDDLWEPGSAGRQVWNTASNTYETWLADPTTGELERDTEGRPVRAAWHDWEDEARPYPMPEDRGRATLSDLGTVEYVGDLVRPGRILVHAATEGSGKSYTECELGIRLAVAGGTFAGTWPVLVNGPVLVMSEMHEDDDYIREDVVMSSLGVSREALVGRYYRLPLLTAAGGPAPLGEPGWRKWVVDWMKEHGTLLLIIDTATGATQKDPWGHEMQAVYAALRQMLEDYPALAIILVVHLKKPAAGSNGKRDITAVMGEWGRWCDVVLLQENDGDSLERTRLTTLKRVSQQRRIVATKAGGLLVDAMDVDQAGPSHVPTEDILTIIRDQPGITYVELAAALDKSKDTAMRWTMSLGDRVDRRQEGPRNAVHMYLTAAPPQTAAQAYAAVDAAVVTMTAAPPHAPYRGAAVGAAVVSESDAVVEEVDETPPPTSLWLRPCRQFSGHLNHHRQTDRGWVCDTCDTEEKS